MGLAHEILGERKEALKAYREAVRVWETDPLDVYSDEEIAEERNRLQKHVRRLSRRGK